MVSLITAKFGTVTLIVL